MPECGMQVRGSKGGGRVDIQLAQLTDGLPGLLTAAHLDAMMTDDCIYSTFQLRVDASPTRMQCYTHSKASHWCEAQTRTFIISTR